uniref:Uncharacterized protein n=1 Tax=Chromera velia CCMP2878 TaxID=1169474 RepID=A0A0G4HJK9_9ALVE|mmetsp:Transcript_42966/g.84721  ORF Transcript_42966/g.84721 Transcript_42966/m.84721 type:complete len:360 (-) Transcript_42966:79-1158(-)|eukprot:Cvel_7092.t1-p1 / transcript=Cvel_7092.t1 / gene=Cvel_7092 / organism=Chromera_velia_CCMP2878 / gene_product=60 kDa lysophospholipase, putative / transcript_product=60 kDa lysophospholipase, putative / location=Cvel_scaffold363:40596-41672(-) / protein_length=359 / sequence_SO=supercontig / SO=protein_coding / is_pseudo=false
MPNWPLSSPRSAVSVKVESDPETLAPVLTKLDCIEENLYEAIQTVQKYRGLLESLKFPQRKGDGNEDRQEDETLSPLPSIVGKELEDDFESPKAKKALLPTDACVFLELRQAIHGVKGQLRRGLDKILSRHYFLDLGPLFSRDGISSVIRSFRSVSPSTLCKAVEDLAHGGQAKDLELLLEVGADLNSSHRGTTPLCRAVSSGSLVAVQLLVDAGADVNMKETGSSSTPLLIACRNRHFGIVYFLVSRGVDVESESPQLQELVSDLPTEVTEFLVQQGAVLRLSRAAEAGGNVDARMQGPTCGCVRLSRCIARVRNFLTNVCRYAFLHGVCDRLGAAFLILLGLIVSSLVLSLPFLINQ